MSSLPKTESRKRLTETISIKVTPVTKRKMTHLKSMGLDTPIIVREAIEMALEEAFQSLMDKPVLEKDRH